MSQITLSPLASFNSAVPWGLWVSVYVWLVGISAGSFFLVMWGNLKDHPHLKQLTRMGISLSVSTLLVGLLSILIDLGHIERFYKLFTSPSPASPMSATVILYNVYFLILAISFHKLKKGFTRPFLNISLLFAVGVIVVESLLFAMPPGRHWHSPVFVLHFVTSSFVSAIAALIYAAFFFTGKETKEGILKALAKVAVPIVLVNLALEVTDLALVGELSRMDKWILPLGNIIALALLLKHNMAAIMIAGTIELIGILVSKYNILISAQMVEPYAGFSRAYVEPRIQFIYRPTGFEFLVSVFLISAAAVFFYILYKIFPLTREE